MFHVKHDGSRKLPPCGPQKFHVEHAAMLSLAFIGVWVFHVEHHVHGLMLFHVKQRWLAEFRDV